ncbi:cyanobactin maturation protease PatG family protein [Streptomyces sp. NPDC003863]
MSVEGIRAEPAGTAPEGDATVGGCPTCQARHSPAASPRPFVYALGQIELRFPNQGVEKELAQSISRADTAGLTDRQALSTVLNLSENRYLARQVCYVFTVQGVDAYILAPRDPADYALLAEAVRPDQQATALDCIIGVRGAVDPPEPCGDLSLPVVTVDQVYSFAVSDLLGAIEKPESMAGEAFDRAAEDLLRTVIRVSGNAGATDKDRALTYLLVRYSGIYQTTFQRSMDGFSLSAIDVRPSAVDGARRVMDVVLSYTSRSNDVTEKQFVSVDVTDEFPFRRHGISDYCDHH